MTKLNHAASIKKNLPSAAFSTCAASEPTERRDPGDKHRMCASPGRRKC